MKKLVDLSGRKFGRLSIVGRSGADKYGNVMWHCNCDCGNTKDISGASIRRGSTTSCGCYGKEARSKSNTKHGMQKSTEYRVWADMLQRCTNTKSASYSGYGARGITVCDDWKEFSVFFKDMGSRPSKLFSLDRIDNDSGYSPSNCRWADSTVQGLNKRARSDSSSGIAGVSWNNPTQKHHVYISAYGTRRNLGYVVDFFEACCLRKAAELEYL